MKAFSNNCRFNSAVATVIVGETKKDFFVHETLITRSSSFFQAALSKNWKEGQTKTVELPGTKPEIFHIYLDWLYTGPQFAFTKATVASDRVSTEIRKPGAAATTPPQPSAPASTAPSVHHEWIKWHDCYELGSYLLDTDFRDALIDMATEKMSSEDEYNVDSTKYIYPSSTGQSPHRKLAVELAVNVWFDQSFQQVPEANYPSEFLADLVVELGPKVCFGSAFRSTEDVSIHSYTQSSTDCKFHEHTLDDEECYLTKRMPDR